MCFCKRRKLCTVKTLKFITFCSLKYELADVFQSVFVGVGVMCYDYMYSVKFAYCTPRTKAIVKL